MNEIGMIDKWWLLIFWPINATATTIANTYTIIITPETIIAKNKNTNIDAIANIKKVRPAVGYPNMSVIPQPIATELMHALTPIPVVATKNTNKDIILMLMLMLKL